MHRLLVHVEGETEINFVEKILGPYLKDKGSCSVRARKVGNGSDNSRRGGNRKWQGVKAEIVRHLREDRSLLVTTMIDFFRLPEDYPSRHAVDVPDAIERGMKSEVAYGDRFIAFVMLHETEALLFADCEALPIVMEQPKLEAELTRILQEHGGPENINTAPEKAPSKQIEQIVNDKFGSRFEKVNHGVPALELIGMEPMMTNCPHFAEWVRKLEARAQM